VLKNEYSSKAAVKSYKILYKSFPDMYQHNKQLKQHIKAKSNIKQAEKTPKIERKRIPIVEYFLKETYL
jgi:hypothetical protein